MMPFGSAIRRCRLACVAVVEAKLGEVELDPGPVENSHHDAFAEHRRQGRDADVDLDAADHGLDAAVLRQPPLGDIELGHDLYARGQRSPQRRGHQSLLLQKSVDAVPNGDRVASGFDVHVGRATLDRPCNDLVHQPDDRRLVGDIAQPLDVEFAAVVA